MRFNENITFIEKLEIVCNITNQKFTEKLIADMLGCTRQNIHRKINRKNFRENDMQKYADLFGYNFILEIIDKKTGLKASSINEMRKAKGISLEELGKMDGINFSSTIKKLKRKSGMTEESILHYCKLLNCQRNFIFENKITGEKY